MKTFVSFAFGLWVASVDGGRGKAQSLDLNLPRLEPIPSDIKLNKPTQNGADELKPRMGSAEYAVVSVEHALSFRQTPQGSFVPDKTLTSIRVGGTPLATEAFSSLIRIQCAQRLGARITVEVFDPQDRLLMVSQGTLSFTQPKTDIAEFPIDWAPSRVRRAGNFTIKIKVAGVDLGSWPLPLVESPT